MMMLEKEPGILLISSPSQHIFKDAVVLIYYAQKWQSIDYPGSVSLLFIQPPSELKGKGKRGQCLASPCWNIQGEHPVLQVPTPNPSHSILIYLIPQRIDAIHIGDKSPALSVPVH